MLRFSQAAKLKIGKVTGKAPHGRRKATFWSDLMSFKRWARPSKTQTMILRKDFMPRSKRVMKPEVTAAAGNLLQFSLYEKVEAAIPTTIATSTSTSTIIRNRCESYGACS